MGEIKTAYIEELEYRLNNLDNKLTIIQSRLKKPHPPNSGKLFVQMKTLREQSDAIREKLSELSKTDHPNWEHIKDEIEEAWAFLQQGATLMASGLKHQWDEL